VIVEHRLSATLPNGRPYVNDYCFVYEVRDGKAWRIREYMDTRGGWALQLWPLRVARRVAGADPLTAQATDAFAGELADDRFPSASCT